MIEILKIDSTKDLKKFIDFPHKLFNDDPNYVPAIYLDQKEFFNPQKNPFYKHSKATLFLALKDGQVAGRIAAIRNNNYIEYTKNNWGFFGFFDVIDDYEVAKSLFETACKWAKKEGLDKILGPENFSTNDTCGLLIEGFDSPPLVMMTYNKKYYPVFLEKFGFEKQTDILAYKLMTDEKPEKVAKLAKVIEKRLNKKNIVIRKIRVNDFDEEIRKIRVVYNQAWSKNWGFVPMTKEEFEHTAKDLKMIMDPDFVLVAEQDGILIGYSLVLPDINQAIIKLKRGRLLPFGIFKLLYYKRKIDATRIITLGIIEEYRKLGIDICFYMKAFETAKEKKIKYGEASWVLENNHLMVKALEQINGKLYKRYRIYTFDLE